MTNLCRKEAVEPPGRRSRAVPISRAPACVAMLVLAGCAVAAPPEAAPEPAAKVAVSAQPVYSDVRGFGEFNGVEWQIDAPWRMEPDAAQEYDAIPLTVSFFDVRSQQDGQDPPWPIRAFCGLYVLEDYPGAPPQLIRPQEFHEFEASLPWLDDGRLAPGDNQHVLRRVWAGESPELVQVIDQWSEWHGTALYRPQNASPGEDLKLIVAARVSTTPSCSQPDLELSRDELLWQFKRGRVSNFNPFTLPGSGPLDRSSDSFIFGDFLKVHYAEQPLPRFGEDWLYGDLHYHSQGTDNEGESGVYYRGTIQTMKAMGLDYLFATEHASSSRQITGMHQIFVDDIPGIPSVLSWVEDWLIDTLRENGAGFPVEESDELRDMNAARFSHLHGWLNAPDGVNAQVAESFGSTRSPQIFLGGELDAVPEISNQEMLQGWFRYGIDRVYHWADVCTEVPSALVEYTDFEEDCEDRVIRPGSTTTQWSLRDVQGLATLDYSRQHLVYLPYDSGRADSFIASDSGRYGGANHKLPVVLDELASKNAYAFLAHPVEAASGSGAGRLGPDIVPYSDTQLEAAFASPYVLGLELWNTDQRYVTHGDAKRFPALHEQGTPLPGDEGDGPLNVSFDWRWQSIDETELIVSLAHGTATWDKVLRWGLDPEFTAQHGLPGDQPRKFFMAGGSDAHGDFNYRREGRFFGWSGSNDTAIGKPRNLTYVGPERKPGSNAVSQEQVVDALKSGQFSVTDGPALRIAIDVNGNGVIDEADVPMGGDFEITTTSAPLLVEWKSTPEFGPVTEIDLYVGVFAAGSESRVYAPAGHGVAGRGDCKTDDPIFDSTGREYCLMTDGYVRDPRGWLRFVVPSGQGFAGVRKIDLRPTDYPAFNDQCVMEVIYHDDEITREPIWWWRCEVFDVQVASRLYARAFAHTEGQGAFLRRYAFTNPIWMTTRQPASPPSLTIGNATCSAGTNTFPVTVAPGIVPGTITSKQYRIGQDGAWQPLTGNTITAPGGQTVYLRASACNENGCSGYAQVSASGPTCNPPPPDSPTVRVDFLSCSSGTNSFQATIAPRGTIPVTTLSAQFRIGNGSWKNLGSNLIYAGSAQTVSVRARACNAFGCSAYATASRKGPTCSTGGGGGGGGGGTQPL